MKTIIIECIALLNTANYDSDTLNQKRDEVVTSLKEELTLLQNKFPLYSEFYGHFVQMNDRFESVHVWSEALALKNKGRWEPIAITKEVYIKEMQHSWNNGG